MLMKTHGSERSGAGLPVQPTAKPGTGTPAGPLRSHVIVSTTDLQGRIRYANSAFAAVTGWPVDEVLGRTHSLLRHPDMPAQVYRDLWQTLQRGAAWTGLLMNRRRDGQAYWVKSNILPMVEGGQVVGYASVQHLADGPEVRLADEAYRHWQAGRSGQRGLREGRIVDTGWRALWQVLRNPFDLPVKGRVLMTAALMGLLFGALLAAVLAPAATARVLAPWGGWQVWGVALGATGLVVSACLALYFQGRIVAPLAASMATATAIAGGDALAPFDDSPHAGDLRDFNQRLGQMVARMAAVLKEVHVQTRDIEPLIGRQADDSQLLARRMEAQAAAMDEISGATGRVSAMVINNTAEAAQARQAAEAATAQAQACGHTVQQLLAAVRSVSADGLRIAEFSELIDGIALQTGVLAMNAAAQAARAGEQGQGFAIVAAEVRALAHRTGQAARSIRDLTAGAQQRSVAGEALAGDALQATQAIVDAAELVQAMLGSMHAGAQQQAGDIRDIRTSIDAVNRTTGEVAELAQHSAASAAAMARDVQRMRAAVGIYRFEGRG